MAEQCSLVDGSLGAEKQRCHGLSAIDPRLAWIDRGDSAKPATQLPILDGGFDQVQIAFGIMAHHSLASAHKLLVVPE